MRASEAWLWLAVVAMASATSPLPACPEACECGPGTEGQMEVICPRAPHDSSFHLHYFPQKSNTQLVIKCNAVLTKTNQDLDYVRRMVIGPVRSFTIELCPIDFSLAEFLDDMSVSNIQTFRIRYSNLTNGIDRNMFRKFTNITWLEVINSSITDVPEDLLDDLRNLTSLILRGNSFDLPQTTRLFQNTPKLTRLELAGNKITHMNREMFKNLPNLNKLIVGRNSLKTLQSDIFDDMKTVEVLDLQSNNLTELSSDIFRGLTKLKTLFLSNNNLSSLPEGLFANNRQLQEVYILGNNRLSLPPGLLSNQLNLSRVDLSGNKMASVPADLLWGSPFSSSGEPRLLLSGNKLEDLPQDLLRDSRNLHTLELRNNQIYQLQDNLFSTLRNLKKLTLSNNKLTTITEYTFQGLNALEELNVDGNQLLDIDSSAFRMFQALKILNLSNNKLSFKRNSLGGSSPLNYCVNLERLLLRNNSIGGIFEDWRLLLTKLTVFDLKLNNITRIQANDLNFLSDKLELDLRFNKISRINLRGLEVMFGDSSEARTNPIRVLLDNNPLNCDCEVYELLRYIELKLLPTVYNSVELRTKNLKCSPDNMLISQLKSRQLQCTLSKEHMKGETCPEKCSCFGRPFDRALIVECSSADLEMAPLSLPQFNSYLNQTELRLERNRLVALPNASQPGYSNVTRIYASYNNISKLERDNIPSKLEVLEIEHNQLLHIDALTLARLANETRLHSIGVASNPWRCDCEARDLVNFLQSNYKKVEHSSNVTCSDGRPMSRLLLDDLCSLPMTLIIACSLSVAMLGVIIGTLAALYYRYQREVKVWLFAHSLCLSIVTEHELDKDKLYDAFVSYSHEDEDFVVNQLVPGLESGPTPFKLCLHFRDWVAGEWIPNQIARSVEDSRRTMVVLSPNFVESVWGRMEFRAAHKQALSEGRARVIIVLLGDVGPVEGLDPELKAYLSMNTYVKWGDPWFWDKLRYALPHPPQKMRKTGLATLPPELRVKTSFDDKAGLEPTTPSATTPPATIFMNPLIQNNGLIIPLANAKLITDNGLDSGYIKSV